MLIRLQKALADAGVASRRKAEEYIKDGKVTVNGKIITELGTKVDCEKDIICYNKEKITKSKMIYILLNKPEGYVTTAKDQFNRPTVIDLIKIEERIFPVGRLDFDTSGLLILTNDGDLTYKLTHPKHNIKKVYEAKILGIPNKEDIQIFQKGINIEGKKTSPAEFKIIDKNNNIATVLITITEGRNRQVRKMCEYINHPVLKLKRVQEGDIKLGNLKKGHYRVLTDREIKYLKSL